MRSETKQTKGRYFRVGAVLLIALTVGLAGHRSSTPQATSAIVQSSSAAEAEALVKSVGGSVTHELGIINAVGADLTPSQAKAIRSAGTARLYADEALQTAGSLPDVYFPTLVGADRLHAMGIKGKNVTVAVLDTGMWMITALKTNTAGQMRLLQGYDAIGNRVGTGYVSDESGHGTHVTSMAMTIETSVSGKYNGVAPDANLVMVKAFDRTGAGTYANVIRGLNWILANRNKYGIRVLNCSFAAPANSRYWDDPVNQAITKLWQAGVVVVASAGNKGPNPMTIGVPGNNPYVITVGAMTDNYTPSDASDDKLASFSSTGPTTEGFVKPEIVAPGGHCQAAMDRSDYFPNTYPQFHSSQNYFTMSGTSQSAAVVSGVAALILQYYPSLTPDMVKFRIMNTANPRVKSDGTLAYTPFQQGAGEVDAYDAVMSSSFGTANAGLNVNNDAAGTAHYGGPAQQYPNNGAYYIPGMSAYTWNGSYQGAAGYIWSNAYVWSNGYIWSNAYVWSNGLTEAASINTWVNQE